MWNLIIIWNCFRASVRCNIKTLARPSPTLSPARIPRFLRAGVLFFCLLVPALALAAGTSVGHNASTRRSAAKIEARPPAVKTGQSIYEQPPFTEKELTDFMEVLPRFLLWARGNKAAYPIINEVGKPDFFHTPAAAAKIQEFGRDPKRFFCLLGRTAAALYLVEEGSDLTGDLPEDMPPVTREELALVRKHLTSLLRAGAEGPPPAISR